MANPLESAAAIGLRVINNGESPPVDALCECGSPVEVLPLDGKRVVTSRCRACFRAAITADEEREDAEMRAAADLRWSQDAGIPLLMRNWSFDTYPGKQSALVDRCRRYADDFQRGTTTQGLMLMGPTGTAKSALAVSILSALRLTKTNDDGSVVPDCLFVNSVDLSSAIVSSWSRHESEPKLYATAMRVSLLVLDDLGLEHDKDWAARELYRLVNHRHLNMLPVIVATNVEIEDLTSRLGARTVSRLTDMCEPLKIKGPDLRLVARRVKRERADLA